MHGILVCIAIALTIIIACLIATTYEAKHPLSNNDPDFY